MKRVLRAWYWLLAFLMLACGPVFSGDHGAHLPAIAAYDFWIDPGVDAANSAALREAADEWTTYTDVRVTIHTGPHVCILEGCFNVIELPEKTLDTVVGEHYVGWTVPYLITLTPAQTDLEVQDTAIHEMGHALGLPHPCTSPCSVYAVMNPTYGNGALHVACYDVAQFYLVRNQEIPPGSTCTDVAGALGPLAPAPDAGGGNSDAGPAPATAGGGPPPRPTTSTRPQ